MRNNSKFGLLLLVMALSVCNVAFAKEAKVEPEDKAPEHIEVQNKEAIELAQEAMSKKDFQSAIVYLTSYINAKPKKYEAYKLRGQCFSELHQFNLAEIDLKRAIELKTSDDKFLTNTKVLGAMVLGVDKQSQYQNPELGELYGMLMYAQKSLNNSMYEMSYQRAFEYNSHIYLPKPNKADNARINCPQKFAQVLNPQGVDLDIKNSVKDIENGQFYEAVYDIQNITSAYPQYYYGYYLMGVAMVGMEKKEEAIQSFEKALKLNPYDYESVASLGQLYYAEAEKTFSKDDALKSIEYFKKALKTNPNSYLYQYYIGLNYMIIGDYPSAVTSFNSAIKAKSNDYNSLYYKLVAQYMMGEYQAVVDGTSNLIYHNVSNYNSVLYLRALAYHRLGKDILAISDIEKIHNNMNDVYNSDLKSLSQKERTLTNYLFYLKAQILLSDEQGAKADLAKAYSNPIIATLARSKNGLNQDFRLTAKQVDTQYDYIRTTFDDLNISFVYEAPNYKFTSLVPTSNEIAKVNPNVLKQSTDPKDTLLPDNQVSIAQMLATKNFEVPNTQSDVQVDDFIPKVENSTIVKAEEPKVVEVEETEKVAMTPEKEEVAPVENKKEDLKKSETKAPSVTIVELDGTKPVEIQPTKTEAKVNYPALVSAKKTETKVKEEPKTIVDVPKSDLKFKEHSQEVQKVEPEKVVEVKKQEVKVQEPVKEVQKAEPEKVVEVKKQDVKVQEPVKEVQKVEPEKVVEVKKQEVKVQEPVKEVQKVEPEKVVEVKKQDVKVQQKPVEKYAKVDLKEFNVTPKKVLVIQDGDEIVDFELPKKSIVEIQQPKAISQIKEENSLKEKLATNSAVENVKSDKKPVDINITQDSVSTKDKEAKIVVPDVKITVPEEKVAAKKVVEEKTEIAENKEVKVSSPTKKEETTSPVKLEKPKKEVIKAQKPVKEIKKVEKVEELEKLEEVATPEKQAVKEDLIPTEIAKEEADIVKNLVEQGVKEAATEVQKTEEKVEKEAKKSRFNFFKRKAKVENETSEAVQQIVDDIIKPVEEPKAEDLTILDNQYEDVFPRIRTTKASIEKPVSRKTKVKKQEDKKKFVWWWNRDKSDETKQEDVENNTKNIDWKKFFTRNPKENIEEDI